MKLYILDQTISSKHNWVSEFSNYFMKVCFHLQIGGAKMHGADFFELCGCDSLETCSLFHQTGLKLISRGPQCLSD